MKPFGLPYGLLARPSHSVARIWQKSTATKKQRAIKLVELLEHATKFNVPSFRRTLHGVLLIGTFMAI